MINVEASCCTFSDGKQNNDSKRGSLGDDQKRSFFVPPRFFACANEAHILYVRVRVYW